MQIKEGNKMEMKLTKIDLLNSESDGIFISSFGRGQLSATTYTIPAHGEIEIDFKIQMMCVTPDNVKTLSELIRSLLDMSKKHLFDEVEKKNFSGGIGFFGFWGGSASASYESTKHTMDSWGLSEENQQAIVNAMMKLSQEMSSFGMKGYIRNLKNDYAVSGNLCAIVMDCEITQGTSQNHVRLLAPNVAVYDKSGSDVVPSVGKLY